MNIVTTKTIRETYKGINELKKGYQPLAYVIKKHDGTIVADIKQMGTVNLLMLIKVLASKEVKYSPQGQTS